MKKSKSSWMLKLLIFALTFSLSGFLEIYAQEHIVSGTIFDESTGNPLLGATVSIKGTTNGTVTDIDGNYTLKASPEGVLVVNYLGYLPEEVAIGGQTTVNINLTPDVANLEQVVVIGYGVQKKKLNTGATLNVSGEDIQQMNTTGTMDALKGITPGVSITQNNGSPGAGNKIYIRGIGTIGNSNPLYIVDGVAVGDIDNLSPSDIESIDVLKDAASAAIYGSRGANGVVLVSTKKGKKSDAPIVNYSTYYGIQNVYKGPGLVDAQQYVELMTSALDNAGSTLDFESQVPDWAGIQSGTNKGTNWFDLITDKNAPVMSHALNVTGGSEVSTFSLGASYYNQSGILGKQANNDYKRMNIRFNSEHILFKTGSRNLVVLGENFTYTNENNPTIRNGNIYWSDVHNMLVASPLLPMYAQDYAAGDPYETDWETSNGSAAMDDPSYPYHYAIGLNSNEANPIASMINQSKWNTNNNNTIIGNVYLNIQPIRNLNIRSAFGINNWYGASRSWTPAYSLSEVSNATNDNVSQSAYMGYTWTATNTVSYDLTMGSNNFSVMLGSEQIKNARSLNVSGSNDSSIFGRYEYAYLDNFVTLDATNATKASFGGRDDFGWAMSSFFGRLSYNYNEKYMATAVMRYDGSSKFSTGHRWGAFPSVSAGWVISKEDFMQSTSSWLNSAKLRASWGRNGNQDIASFAYLSTISLEGANYYFGTAKDAVTTGSTPARVPNDLISWEKSEQTNIGSDMYFLNNRLQFTIDWYQKDTKDWLIEKISSSMDGTDAPWVNGGLVRNKGFETMLGWNDNRGDFKYGVTATFAFNKNLVVEIPSEDSIYHGPANVLSQGVGEMFRAEAGYPIGYFWGYETDGIFKTEDDAAAWVRPTGSVNTAGDDMSGEPYFNSGQAINQQHAGDVKFIDKNQDGLINDDDKVMIGNPHPDVIIGLQVNLEYKGVYLNVVGNGMLGHQIAKNYRSVDSYLSNYTQYDYDEVWRESNPDGTLPQLYPGGGRNYQYVSDIYIFDADFFRISNMTIGCNLNKMVKGFPFQSTKVYLAVNNLHTFTKYPFMDPEVGYSPDGFSWGSGIDLGLYPQARTFMVGTNITF